MELRPDVKYWLGWTVAAAIGFPLLYLTVKYAVIAAIIAARGK